MARSKCPLVGHNGKKREIIGNSRGKHLAIIGAGNSVTEDMEFGHLKFIEQLFALICPDNIYSIR